MSSVALQGLKGFSGWSPLHLAVQAKAINTAALLVEHGARVDAVTTVRFEERSQKRNDVDHKARFASRVLGRMQDGHTALGLAILSGSDEMVRMLIEAKANVNQKQKV